MRLLNVLFTALAAAFALVAGLVAAALIAVVGSAFIVFKRFRRPAAVTAAPSPTRWNSKRETDVIDVTATEVVAERVGPSPS